MTKDPKTRLYPSGYGCEVLPVANSGDRCPHLCHRNMGDTDCGGRTCLGPLLKEIPVKLVPPDEVPVTQPIPTLSGLKQATHRDYQWNGPWWKK